MIITDLKSLDPYKAMSENMKVAIEYLESLDFNSMSDGKYRVEGDEVYVVVSTYLTREHDVSKYEVHQNYIDMQCLIEGEEIIFCNEVCRMEADGSYNAETDKLNLKDKVGEVSIHLKPGMAAIFYPNDAHKACCKVGEESEQVRKLLVKVRV